MKWRFWQKETRDSGGSFNDALIRYIEAQAAGTVADSGSTAAVEAAAGQLSRSLAGATSNHPGVSRDFLARVGRDLIRKGQSLHLIDVTSDGRVRLLPCASWHFEGGISADTWHIRSTLYGPSTSVTRFLPYSAYIYIPWDVDTATPYEGIGPLQNAATTARMGAETEKSLADEVAGPLAQILPIPQDGGDGGEDDPLVDMKADLKGARGMAVLVETTAAAWGEGRGNAPQSDWKAHRLGPNPPASLPAIQKQAFANTLAACGMPPSLYESGADGTSQREALRRFHLNTVIPIASRLEDELSLKLDRPVKLSFDNYPLDLQGRAAAFQKMVQAGTPIEKAAALTGLVSMDE